MSCASSAQPELFSFLHLLLLLLLNLTLDVAQVFPSSFFLFSNSTKGLFYLQKNIARSGSEVGQTFFFFSFFFLFFTFQFYSQTIFSCGQNNICKKQSDINSGICFYFILLAQYEICSVSDSAIFCFCLLSLFLLLANTKTYHDIFSLSLLLM